MVDVVVIGVGIVLLGFLMIFLAAVMAGRSSEEGEKRTEVRGGGVVMIGPIPIIFGSDAKWASVAIVLAMALIVIALLSGVLFGQ